MLANIVTVDGTDLYEEYGLVLSVDYVIPVAEYRDFSVDLMGDGKLDLSEFSGDLLFQNRELKLPMFTTSHLSVVQYENLKTRIAGELHGKRCEILLAVDQLPDEPGQASNIPFVHTGRIKAFEFKRVGGVLTVDMTVDADPFKTRGLYTIRAAAAGGHTFELPNGRARTQPTVEVYKRTEITHDGETFTLEPGTWKLPTFWLHGGTNLVAVNTAPDFSAATWGTYVGTSWDSHEGETWAEMQANGAEYPTGDGYKAYFQYEWRDL